jgi:hypothetical protein
MPSDSCLMTSDSFHSDDGHGMRRSVVMLLCHELWVVAQTHVGEYLQDIHKETTLLLLTSIDIKAILTMVRVIKYLLNQLKS